LSCPVTSVGWHVDRTPRRDRRTDHLLQRRDGYTVLRLHPSKLRRGQVGEDGLATVVGTLPELQPGESVRFTGGWTSHSEYGSQFRADSVFGLREEVIRTAAELLNVPVELCDGAVDGLRESGQILVERIPLPSDKEVEALYLPALYHSEHATASQ
jgi:hypothetical protein